MICNLIISYSAGCATTTADYKKAVTKPAAPLICVLAQFVLRPLAAFCLCLLCNVEANAAIGILLCRSAPGGNGSNLMEVLFDGNVSLGIVCTTVSSFVAAGGIPLDVWLFVRRFESVDFQMPWMEICLATGCVVVGATLGSYTTYKFQELGKKLESRMGALGVLVLLGTIVFVVVEKWQSLLYIEWQTWLASTLIAPLAIIFGYQPARSMGMIHPRLKLDKRDARSVAIETGECNIGVAYAIMSLVWKAGPKQDIVFTGIMAYTVMNQVFVWGVTAMWMLESKHQEKTEAIGVKETPFDDISGKEASRAKYSKDVEDWRRPVHM